MWQRNYTYTYKSLAEPRKNPDKLTPTFLTHAHCPLPAKIIDSNRNEKVRYINNDLVEHFFHHFVSVIIIGLKNDRPT